MNTRVVGNYLLMNRIGSGASADVFLGIHSVSRRPVAVKRISRSLGEERIQKAKGIYELIKNMNFPFIMKIYDFFEDQDFAYVVLEYCQSGTLMEILDHERALPEQKVAVIILELTLALRRLHKFHRIIHRDIKVDNILMDRFGHIRLSDFGFSTVMETDKPIKRTACGSPAYAAPEMITREAYSSKTDIWSLGVVMYVLLVGRLPFTGANIQECMKRVVEVDPQMPDYLSPQCQDLLVHLLKKNPIERYDEDQILVHPFITNIPAYQAFMNASECNGNIVVWDLAHLVTETIRTAKKELKDMPEVTEDDILFKVMRDECLPEILNSRIGSYATGYRTGHRVCSVAYSTNKLMTMGMLPTPATDQQILVCKKKADLVKSPASFAKPVVVKTRKHVVKPTSVPPRMTLRRLSGHA